MHPFSYSLSYLINMHIFCKSNNACLYSITHDGGYLRSDLFPVVEPQLVATDGSIHFGAWVLHSQRAMVIWWGQECCSPCGLERGHPALQHICRQQGYGESKEIIEHYSKAESMAC